MPEATNATTDIFEDMSTMRALGAVGGGICCADQAAALTLPCMSRNAITTAAFAT